MRNILFLILLFTNTLVTGQIEYDPDTLTYNERIGGTIDSIDIRNADLPTTFDGGRSISSPIGRSTLNFYQNLTSRTFQRFSSFDKIKFSALPHFGFAYSFGGQSAQFIRLRYSQVFNEHLILNVNYDRNSGTGAFRSNTFQRDDLTVQLQREALRYSFQLKGSYQARSMDHSGGMLIDSTLIEDLGLEFTPVLKGDASSKVKLGTVGLKNYINITGDSSNHFGLTTSHNYAIVNRVYLESDTDSLHLIYPNVFIDSITTRDQFNWASISNAGGVYFSNIKSRFYIDGLIEHTYWGFQNLGKYTDTNEINLVSNARIRVKDFELRNKFNFNIVGAYNQWGEDVRLVYKRPRFKLSGGLTVQNIAPDPLQRKYFANNYQYALPTIENQFWLRTGGKVLWNIKDSSLTIGAGADFTNLSSTYLFDGETWRSDSLGDFSFASVGVKATVSFGILNIHPSIVYTADAHGYLPEVQVYTRLFLKARLFKAKKLEALIGVDGSYISSFNHQIYNPAMDLMDWYSAPGNTKPLTNLHFFTTLGIDEFRFYVRYENIGYFWNDKTSQEISGYPIAGTRVRIGLTWDFFN